MGQAHVSWARVCGGAPGPGRGSASQPWRPDALPELACAAVRCAGSACSRLGARREAAAKATQRRGRAQRKSHRPLFFLPATVERLLTPSPPFLPSARFGGVMNLGPQVLM